MFSHRFHLQESQRSQAFFISDDEKSSLNQNVLLSNEELLFENEITPLGNNEIKKYNSYHQDVDEFIDEIDENVNTNNLSKKFLDQQQTSKPSSRFLTSSPSSLSPIMLPPRNVAFTNFVSFNPNHANKNASVSTNILEIEDDNFFVQQNDKQIRLPPRLAARLMKQKPQIKNSKQEVFKTPLIRRETMVLKSKNPQTLPSSFKSNNCLPKENVYKNHDVNSDDDNEKQISKTNNSLNETLKINTDEEDFRYQNWFNSIIKVSFNIENVTIDFRRIINDCVLTADMNSGLNSMQGSDSSKKSKPLKDGVSSIAYKEEKLMDVLRVKAALFYEENVKPLEEHLMGDLKIPRYHIRKDKNIQTDVGAKKYILEIILNYNPLWLKVALECVFGIRVEKTSKSRSEVHTLIHILTARLLSFKDLAQKKGFKNVTTYFMKDTNVLAAKRHILYHFLLIIDFLDVAKRHRLIDHDPCLFRTDATVKSTRDILISFSREFITGVGDITKAVRSVGIQLEHIQSPIEEVNFSLNNIRTELRDGIRLGRLAEILLSRNDILPRLQFPPNSITRKIHNMELVFSILVPHFHSELSKAMTPRDLCNGWRNKTLEFLDKCIDLYNERLRLIELQQSIQSIIKIQRTFRRYMKCRSERRYFILLKEKCIWLQRHYRAKQKMGEDRGKFLKLRNTTINIQRRFRENQLFKRDRNRFLELKSSVICIQRYFIAYLAMRQQQSQYKKLRETTCYIQKLWRRKQLSKKQRQEFLMKRFLALRVQALTRGFLARKRFSRLKALTDAALIVQRRFRANKEMKTLQKQYHLMRRSAIIIQQYYRGKLETQKIRFEFLQLRQSTIIVQKTWRCFKARKQYLKIISQTIVIQRHVKSWLQTRHERATFIQLKQATILVQRKWRSKQLVKSEREHYLLIKQSISTIQRALRTHLERKRFIVLREAAITIQRRWKENREARFQLKRFLHLKNSVIKIQRFWREYQHRCKLISAAIVIQQKFRAKLQMRQCRAEFLQIKQAVITVQRRYRAFLAGKKEYQAYQSLRKVTIMMQLRWREKQRGNRFLRLVILYVTVTNKAAISIQSFWRGHQVRRELDSQFPFKNIRNRLQKANEGFTEDKTLLALFYRVIERISRTKSTINTLQKDFEVLECCSEFSREISLLILENESLIPLLIETTTILNRSVPHKHILNLILGIMINLIKQTGTKIFFDRSDLLPILIKNFRHFSNVKELNNNIIISRTIKLMTILISDSKFLKMLKRDKSSVEFIQNHLVDILQRNQSSSKLTRFSTNLISSTSFLLKKLK